MLVQTEEDSKINLNKNMRDPGEYFLFKRYVDITQVYRSPPHKDNSLLQKTYI